MCCPVALLRLPGLQRCERRPGKAKPPPGNTLLHSRHIIRIHILTVAQRVAPAGAFDLKAVLLIHRNRRGIIGEHRQLNTPRRAASCRTGRSSRASARCRCRNPDGRRQPPCQRLRRGCAEGAAQHGETDVRRPARPVSPPDERYGVWAVASPAELPSMDRGSVACHDRPRVRHQHM